MTMPEDPFEETPVKEVAVILTLQLNITPEDEVPICYTMQPLVLPLEMAELISNQTIEIIKQVVPLGENGQPE